MDSIDPEKSDHRWGFKDSGFELRNGTVYFKGDRYPYIKNSPLPHMREFIEKALNITLSPDVNPTRPIVIPKKNRGKLPIAFRKAMKSFPDQFSDSERECIIHSHGQTTTDEIYKILYQGGLKRYVNGVFYPKSEEDLEKIINLATRHRIVLIPYGGGTSVSSALLLPLKEKRPIISVDMRQMDQIEWIDDENGLAMIQAGIVGRHLEEKLNLEGYTMGHEPDSIEFSTLGGWISTHASGMKRSRYGNIEDIVVNYTLITPQGKVEEIFPYLDNKNRMSSTKKVRPSKKNSSQPPLSCFDRTSIGMEAKKLLFGSEGNLGFISKALVKIRTLPEEKRYDSFLFPNFSCGIAFLKELSRKSFQPASIRLIDNRQFQFGYALRIPKPFLAALMDKFKKWILLNIKKFDPNKMSLATVVFEGDRSEVNYQNQKIKELAICHGGIKAGSENGHRGYILTMVIAYIRDFVSDYYSIGETLETTVPWNCIDSLCRGLDEEMMACHQEYRLPGKYFVTSRITQLYHSGVCIYITIALYLRGVKNPEKVFSKIEKRIRTRVLKEGGSLSHHHGIGKLRKDFHRQLLTPANKTLLRQIKKSLDPQNIFAAGNNIFSN